MIIDRLPQPSEPRMPIVTVELVSDTPAPAGASQRLADACGALFDSAPGTTWVRVRHLPHAQYAENATELTAAVQPTFVEVLHRHTQPEAERRREARALAACVATVLERPANNVHVLYAAPGAGRIAFGGELVTAGGD